MLFLHDVLFIDLCKESGDAIFLQQIKLPLRHDAAGCKSFHSLLLRIIRPLSLIFKNGPNPDIGLIMEFRKTKEEFWLIGKVKHTLINPVKLLEQKPK